MTREKKNATLGHFSKEGFGICVNEKTVEGEICGRKAKRKSAQRQSRKDDLLENFVTYL